MIKKYAKIDSENIVSNIILCDDSEISSQSGTHVEITNSTNQAIIGFGYSYEKNKFEQPKPYDSWTLNEDTLLWEAPIAKPEGATIWNEEDQSWIIPE